MAKFYTGVGHRKENILPGDVEMIEDISKRMYDLGYTLLSGGASGADTAFCKHSGGLNLIYLPFSGFQSSLRKHTDNRRVLTNYEAKFAYMYLSHKAILPEITRMSASNIAYHLRNFYQSYNGGDLPDLCIYYAKENEDGTIDGGTRTAVYTARHFDIPTFNVYTQAGRDSLDTFLQTLTMD